MYPPPRRYDGIDDHDDMDMSYFEVSSTMPLLVTKQKKVKDPII
jgi:hypothetical protein